MERQTIKEGNFRGPKEDLQLQVWEDEGGRPFANHGFDEDLSQMASHDNDELRSDGFHQESHTGRKFSRKDVQL